MPVLHRGILLDRHQDTLADLAFLNLGAFVLAVGGRASRTIVRADLCGGFSEVIGKDEKYLTDTIRHGDVRLPWFEGSRRAGVPEDGWSGLTR